ncbi:hypothetical protein HBB16_11835 [Pseudonocardia sp. MCCB 268]|nr:hypothetical protein [Pseudonocardia cytotoxica]
MLPAVRDHGAVATLRASSPADRGIDFRAVIRADTREQAKLDQLRQHVEDGRLTLRSAEGAAGRRLPEPTGSSSRGHPGNRVVLEF